MQMYSKPPTAQDPRGWVFGKAEQDIIVPFEVQAKDLLPDGFPEGELDLPPIGVAVRVSYVQRALTKEEEAEQRGAIDASSTQPAAATQLGPALPSTSPVRAIGTAPPPQVRIEFLDENQNILVGFDKLKPPTAQTLPPDPRQGVQVEVPGSQVAALVKAKRFF